MKKPLRSIRRGFFHEPGPAIVLLPPGGVPGVRAPTGKVLPIFPVLCYEFRIIL
jgi:hypothetical protein